MRSLFLMLALLPSMGGAAEARIIEKPVPPPQRLSLGCVAGEGAAGEFAGLEGGYLLPFLWDRFEIYATLAGGPLLHGAGQNGAGLRYYWTTHGWLRPYTQVCVEAQDYRTWGYDGTFGETRTLGIVVGGGLELIPWRGLAMRGTAELGGPGPQVQLGLISRW